MATMRLQLRTWASRSRNFLNRRSSPNPGQTNVEYALILTLVAVASASVLAAVGQNLVVAFSSVSTALAA